MNILSYFNNVYGFLLLFLTIAAATPVISSKMRKFKVPAQVLEILAGIIIVRALLINNSVKPVIEMLSSLGMVFFVFMLGFEINFDILFNTGRKNEQKSLLPLCLAIYGLSLVLSYLFSVILQKIIYIGNAFSITSILVATASGIVIPLLKENKIIGTAYGQTIVLYMVMTEIISYLLINISDDLNLFSIIYIFSIMVMIMILNNILRTIIKKLWLRKLLGSISSFLNIKLRIVIAFMLFYVFVFFVFGYEPVIGAYLAGISLSFILGSRKKMIRNKLEGLGYGFFIPVFLIIAGSKINVTGTFNSTYLILVLLLVIIFVIVKMLPSLLFLKKYDFKTTLNTGILLSTQFSLLIIGSLIALRKKIISENVYSALIFAAMITSILFPAVFNRLLNRTAIDSLSYKTEKEAGELEYH